MKVRLQPVIPRRYARLIDPTTEAPMHLIEPNGDGGYTRRMPHQMRVNAHARGLRSLFAKESEFDPDEPTFIVICGCVRPRGAHAEQCSLHGFSGRVLAIGEWS
jgi:hypothetical protein